MKLTTKVCTAQSKHKLIKHNKFHFPKVETNK